LIGEPGSVTRFAAWTKSSGSRAWRHPAQAIYRFARIE